MTTIEAKPPAGVWPENVTLSLAAFEDRRRTLLAQEAGLTDGIDRYGAKALTMLVAGRDPAAANAALKDCAEWFEHPVRQGLNGHQGECDFAAIKLCRG